MASSASQATDANDSICASLVAWIRDGGGRVHPSLGLRGRSTSRGIFASAAIPKGDLLIRLPAHLVLSGECMPERFAENKRASPWLRCLASLYRAQKTNKGGTTNNKSKSTLDYTPYLQTLPPEYETLLKWSDDEVSSFLQGTALGHLIQSDRREGALQTRYKVAVRPYLESLNLLSKEKVSEEQEHDTFERASMCLSTRGFHHKFDNCDSTVSLSKDSSYDGPFLLPLIDLLNHDVEQKCTTLKRDPKDQSFYMMAERDIVINEAIYHSYGDGLTSAQVLQTFGFVPQRGIHRAAKNGTTMPSVEQYVYPLTPAILSKANIVKACRSVASSEYPTELRCYMEAQQMADETWDMPPQDMDSRDLASLIPDDILVTSTAPFSDELVTLCCLLLMPFEVYNDFMAHDPALLDKSILEDYFLGKMVCRSLIEATANKLKEYQAVAVTKQQADDKVFLSNLLQHHNLDSWNRRALYGCTVRLEEKASVHALRNEVLAVMDSLDDDNDSETAISEQKGGDSNEGDTQESKRIRRSQR